MDLWRCQLWTELEELERVRLHLSEVTDKLDALDGSDTGIRRLQTTPGVGPRLAETVVAVLDDPHRFQNAKQVGSYVGLTPRQFESDQMSHQGRISKKGNALLRALLVEVSWLALRHNAWARETYERVLRGDPSRKKVAIVAVARKLLVRCWVMWRDETPWSPPAGSGPDTGPPEETRATSRKDFYTEAA